MNNEASFPAVSVIVPVYNLETCVARCLDSIEAQTCPPLEIVVIDDGSSDRTPAILERYAASHPAVRVIRQANAGVDAARYAGMDAARGEYLMFVDGDDALFPDSIEALARAAVRTGADIVMGDYVRHLDRFGLFRRKDGFIPDDRTIERSEFLASYYGGFFGRDAYGLFYNYGKMCMKLYRTSFMLANRPQPNGLRYAEDQLFNLQVFPKADRIALLKKDVYIYRFGGVTGNLTLSLFGDMIRLHETKLTLTDRDDWRFSERGTFLHNVQSFLATLAISGRLKARSMAEALAMLNASSIWPQALEEHPEFDDAFFTAARLGDPAAAWRALDRGKLVQKIAYRLRRVVLKLVR